MKLSILLLRLVLATSVATGDSSSTIDKENDVGRLRRRVANKLPAAEEDKNGLVDHQETSSFWNRMLFESVNSMSSPTPSPLATIAPSTLATIAPTIAADICVGDVSPFRVSILLDLEGKPGLATEADITLLEEVLRDAYNQVALCDQAGSFIRVDNVVIDTDFTDSFGDDIGGGSDVSTPVTWKVDFEGECRGCPVDSDPILFSSLPPSNQVQPGDDSCDCDFPTVETYILQCNELILLQNSSTIAGGFVVFRATVLIALGGSGDSVSFSSFSSQVTVGGTGGFLSGAALSRERTLTSVVPSIEQAPDDGIGDSKPFSVVFNIIGSCRQCGTSTVVFGDHASDAPQDPEALCPAGAVLGCPTESDFRSALEATIQRLQQDGSLIPIETIDDVTQTEVDPPSSVPTPCVPTTSSPTSNFGTSIDLNKWTVDGTNSNWGIQDQQNSVLQTVNGNPTFFCSDFTAFENDLAGVITVVTTSDDDFIGFALGYESGDLTNPNADFLLVDWKQNNQSASGAFGRRGFALSRITGIVSSLINSFWSHEDQIPGVFEELARGITLGDIGWEDNVEYTFRFLYTSTGLKVFVNDVLEIDMAGTFPNGKFCFYNYSQAFVRYSGITQRPIPDPPGCPE